MKTVSLRGKVTRLDDGYPYPTIEIETVDGKPAEQVILPLGSYVDTVSGSQWGGHPLPDLKLGDEYEIRLTPDFQRFVSYHANGWSHYLASGRTYRGYEAATRDVPAQGFVVLHRTAAGRLTVGSEWPTRLEAEEAARDRVEGRGYPHWVAEVVLSIEPGPPVATSVPWEVPK